MSSLSLKIKLNKFKSQILNMSQVEVFQGINLALLDYLYKPTLIDMKAKFVKPHII